MGKTEVLVNNEPSSLLDPEILSTKVSRTELVNMMVQEFIEQCELELEAEEKKYAELLAEATALLAKLYSTYSDTLSARAILKAAPVIAYFEQEIGEVKPFLVRYACAPANPLNIFRDTRGRGLCEDSLQYDDVDFVNTRINQVDPEQRLLHRPQLQKKLVALWEKGQATFQLYVAGSFRTEDYTLIPVTIDLSPPDEWEGWVKTYVTVCQEMHKSFLVMCDLKGKIKDEAQLSKKALAMLTKRTMLHTKSELPSLKQLT